MINSTNGKYYCINSKTFRNKLKTWMVGNLNFGFELTVCEVLFGLPTYNNQDFKLINFLILIGKWYLNNSKTQGKPIFFFVFIILIKEKTEILKHINTFNNQEVESWVTDLWTVL